MARPSVAHIAITTRNRPRALRRLVDQIHERAADVVLPHIYVYDDASARKHKIDETVWDCHYTRFADNHGRDYYWAIIDRIFKDAKRSQWDYLFLLPDDVTLSKNFFTEALLLWTKAGARAACLSFNTDQRIESTNWIGVRPIEKGPLILTQWTDLCFMCDHLMMDELDWTVHPTHRWMSESSGVGSQITRRMFVLGFEMYHSKHPLVHHGDHPSQMHPHHRAVTPLEH
jgi:hypothetical protein